MEKTLENCSCTPDAIGFNLSTTSCHGKKISCKDDTFSKFLKVVVLQLVHNKALD